MTAFSIGGAAWRNIAIKNDDAALLGGAVALRYNISSKSNISAGHRAAVISSGKSSAQRRRIKLKQQHQIRGNCASGGEDVGSNSRWRVWRGDGGRGRCSACRAASSSHAHYHYHGWHRRGVIRKTAHQNASARGALPWRWRSW
jgi:hypothetical protein